MDNSDATYQNHFGLLNEVIFPDGGWVKYVWAMPPAGAAEDSIYNELTSLGGQNFIGYGGNRIPVPLDYGCVWQFQTPVLSHRVVSFDGSKPAQEQDFTYQTIWNYGSNGSFNSWSQKITTVVTKDDLRGGISTKTVYSYLPTTAGPYQPFSNGHVSAQIPIESSIVYYDWGQTKALKVVQKTWRGQFDLASEITTLYSQSGATRISGTKYSYVTRCSDHLLQFSPSISSNPLQSLSLLGEQDDYDFGNGQLGPLKKRTIYGYTCFQPPFPTSGPPVSAIPPEVSSVTIEDGSGRIVSATQYGFDESALTGVDAINHSGVYDENVKVRGNVTSITQCAPLPAASTSTCSGPRTNITYDTTGQPVTMIDPKGNLTTFSFLDQYTDAPPSQNTNAYLTKITYPVAGGAQLTKKFKYSYMLGNITESQDENNQVTTFAYNTNAGCASGLKDRMYRLGEVDYPDGGKTKYCYDDTAHTATKSVLNSPTGTGEAWITTIAKTDGMAHTTQTQLASDPDGATSTDIQYDGEGQVLTVTNPYRGNSIAAPLTTNYYDALGRKVATSEPLSGLLLWCFSGMPSSVSPGTSCNGQLGSVASSFAPGTWVDFTDERGNQWQRTTDVFGNLLEVMEPNGTSHAPSMETDYSYSTLNDLTSVVQYGGAYGASGARSRTFKFDSLSRLVNAYNPESGTIVYTYDLNGNLVTKTDARGVVIAYTYDALNRLLGKVYPNDPTGTPAACFQYGGGRLIDSWTQNGQSCPSAQNGYLTRRRIAQYDPMGRVKAEEQYTLANQATGKIYKPTYNYNADGSLNTSEDGITKSATVQADLLFTFNVGQAGRVQSVTSNWSDATHPATLFSQNSSPGNCVGYQAAQYWPSGSLSNATFGSGISFARTYDDRLRAKCEFDQGTGTQPATPGSATITITGTEQSK